MGEGNCATKLNLRKTVDASKKGGDNNTVSSKMK